MKSKTRKRQEWAYLHTLEIGILNEELLERQAREHRAAAAAAAAVAPAIPPGQDQLEQLAPEQVQTPPHLQEEATQPPPRPVKTPPTPPRAAESNSAAALTAGNGVSQRDACGEPARSAVGSNYPSAYKLARHKRHVFIKCVKRDFGVSHTAARSA